MRTSTTAEIEHVISNRSIRLVGKRELDRATAAAKAAVCWLIGDRWLRFTRQDAVCKTRSARRGRLDGKISIRHKHER